MTEMYWTVTKPTAAGFYWVVKDDGDIEPYETIVYCFAASEIYGRIWPADDPASPVNMVAYEGRHLPLDDACFLKWSHSPLVPPPKEQEIVTRATYDEELVECMQRTLMQLPLHDQEVLHRWLGYGGYPRQTLKAIAQDLGLSTSNIHQRKNAAVQRLRRHIELSLNRVVTDEEWQRAFQALLGF